MAKQGRTYEPSDADRVFVERSVSAGTTINDIADCLNITDDTLRKHFRYEITTARARLKSDAVRVLGESLTDGSLDAAKYVLSRLAGWTETVVNEHTGPNGGPVQVMDTSKISDTALAELMAARNAVAD